MSGSCSGAMKRAKKRKLQEATEKLPKIDTFFRPRILTKDDPAVEAVTHQERTMDDPALEAANNQEPSTSTAVSISSNLGQVALQELQEGPEERDKDMSHLEEDNAVTEQQEGPEEHDKDMSHLEKDSAVTDISTWILPLSDSQRIAIIKNGIFPQNENGPFKSNTRPGKNTKGLSRSLERQWFFVHLPNGESVKRTWMAYSLISNNLYCICCRLFATGGEKSGFILGFKTWWKLNPKVSEHEHSPNHNKNFQKWFSLKAAVVDRTGIDAKSQELILQKENEWRKILHRFLDVTLFLAKQKLPFRGHREGKDSSNRGNFLELIQLLSRYDPVLEELLKKTKKSVQYTSPKIQNEFIQLLGKHLKDKLVQEIIEARYFGMMFDTTPDVAHVDQMSKVIRYVKIFGKSVEVKEVFLGFHEVKGKKAIDLATEISSELSEDGLDIMLCRSQGYDNAANMAGVHGGVQKIIKEKNEKALFNGCIDHQLNLCGQHSFSQNIECVSFFGTVQAVFSFFSVSTARWQKLSLFLKKTTATGVKGVKTLKRLSDTRWSAHFAAVEALKENYCSVLEVLQSMTDPAESLETREAAANLIPAISNFNFVVLLNFWQSVLREVEITQKMLQKKTLTLDKALLFIESLETTLGEERENIVKNALTLGEEVSQEMDFPTEKRTRKRKRQYGEEDTEVVLSFAENLKRVMLECLDRFSTELKTRKTGLASIVQLFREILPAEVFEKREEKSDYLESLESLAKLIEIPAKQLAMEIIRFRTLLKCDESLKEKEEASKWTVLQALEYIVSNGFQECVPGLTVAYRILLTVCPSVATCERSFSVLKLIKSYLRSTMSQERLSSLSILAIERSEIDESDFNAVMDVFARKKAMRTKFI